MGNHAVRVTAIGEDNYEIISSLLNRRASHIFYKWYDFDYISQENLVRLEHLTKQTQYYTSEYVT